MATVKRIPFSSIAYYDAAEFKETETLRSKLLMAKLAEFYSDDEYFNKLLNLVRNKNAVSLRLIDWFITNYVILNTSDDYLYKLAKGYKSQLKSYSKKQFDPFCRRGRSGCINLYDNATGEIVITTTIGQLNFFKWIISNNIMDYIIENIEKIDKQMNANTKKKEVAPAVVVVKTPELTIKGTMETVNENIEIKITFE